MSADATPEDKARLALLNSVPLTRMVDYGMEVGAAQRVRDAVAAGEDLDDAAEREADALLALVDGHLEAVRRPVRRAAIGALAVAQLAFASDSPRRTEVGARITAEVAALAAESGGHLLTVSVPYAGSSLPGLLVRPNDVVAPPVVIVFGGLSGWDVAYLTAADALAAAGVACLLVDLPGQGGARLAGGLLADGRVAEAVSAWVGWALAADDLGDRIGVWGNSFGGLIAAVAAARDPRIGAVCVNGAAARPAVPPFRTAADLMMAFFGSSSVEELAATLPALTLAERGETIDCPLLVLHGGADPMVAAADQRAFLDLATGEATWREWPDGEHTMYNHPAERTALVATWFARTLR